MEMDILEKKIIKLDDSLYREKRGILYRYVLETRERLLIEQALEHTYGNQIKAAKILGINRNTLHSKIKKFGINPNKWKI